MMRGFQIWPQNSNQITFDPPFGQQICWTERGGQMLGQKRGQMLLDLNFDAIFEILSSFSISYDPICYDFHILKF